MVEAQIMCTCPFIGIPDLGLEMKRGQSAIVSEEVARASVDLQTAHKNGGVNIKYIERFQELKPAPVEPPPTTRKVSLPAPVRQSAVQPVEVVRVEKMTLDLDEDALVEKLAAKMNSLRDGDTNALIDSLIGEVQSMREDIAKSQQNPQIVREIHHSEGKVKKDDVPMFIPETIMGKDAKIEIEETISEGTVDEASEALRALRKKKKEKKS